MKTTLLYLLLLLEEAYDFMSNLLFSGENMDPRRF